MGRTPKVNDRGGRDHWANLATLLLAGGGVPEGIVVGQSNRDAGEPATRPIRIPDLVATILHTMVDVGAVRALSGIPADVLRVVTAGEPIPECVG